MILQEDIQNTVSAQKKSLENFDFGEPRAQAENIKPGAAPKFAQLLAGVRRCGKSTLLQQIRRENGGGYYFNFEDPRIAGFGVEDFERLTAALQSEYGKHDSYYFDEIQTVGKWEWYVRQLLDSGKRVVITGSNASLWGMQTGTKLTGRHLDSEVFPFSYSEAIKFKKQAQGPESFSEYLETGGFPECLKTSQQPEILQRLFDDIVARDIIARHGIRGGATLREMGIMLLSNAGKEFSYNSLKKTLGIPAIQTVIDYVSHFQDAYLLFAVQKFDYSFKRRLIAPKKIYAVDTGLATSLSASFSKDKGRLLENAIYLELRRRHGPKNVFYYRNDKECDFVVSEGGRATKAFQVAYAIDSGNEKRETAGLAEAMEKLKLEKGTLITLAQEDRMSIREKEIEIVPAFKWATQKN